MSERAYWMCQITGWTIYLIASLGFGLSFQPFGWKLILHITLCCIIGFILSHAFRVMIRRYQWTHLPLPQLVWRVVLANIIIAFIWLIFASISMFIVLHISTINQFSLSIAIVIWFNWSATIFIWSL
ncbi:MAG: hypothetical protein AB1489_23355, partial [Acidobacteriota bacterium]